MSDDWRPLIRALIYPVQFDPRPEEEVGRVLAVVVDRRALGGERADYLAATRDALNSSEELSRLIPQDHPEEVVRRYLKAVQRALAAGS